MVAHFVKTEKDQINEGSGKSRPVLGGGMKAALPGLLSLALFDVAFDRLR